MDKGLTNSLREMITDLGADLVGFADISILPEGQRGNFPRAISVARKYDGAIIDGITDGPTPEYAKAYGQLNSQLNSLSKRIAANIQSLGFSARALPATVSSRAGESSPCSFEPLDDIQVPIPHKTIATLAGIGWIGKTDLLINERFGPRIRLASVLTDAPFTCDEPVIESRCGTCVACVEACPVDAGRAKNWSRETSVSDRYNVQNCYQFTRTISKERSLNSQLCGMCLAACPYGKK